MSHQPSAAIGAGLELQHACTVLRAQLAAAGDALARAAALALLRAHPAMELAKADTRKWAEVARAEILGLPDVPARAAFEGLCEYVVDRAG